MRSYLYHDGIKGMKWGQRRYQNADGTYTELGKKRRQKQMDKLAKKDAQEYARAKMFYGEGAGNRRKLIKATVNERSKDEYYKQAFDKYFSQQDMAKHAEKATAERNRKDAANSAKKTARGVVNFARGNKQYVGAGLFVGLTALTTAGGCAA